MAQDKLTESYYKSPSSTPVLKTTVSTLIDEATEKHPQREAIVFSEDGVRKTFKELKYEIDQLATGFLALGFKPGDRLVIWAPNCLEWIITQYAAVRTGVIYIGLNPSYDAREVEEILKLLKPKCIVCSPRLKHGDTYQILNDIIPELKQNDNGNICSGIFPELQYIIMCTGKELRGITKFSDVVKLGGGKKELVQIQELSELIQPEDCVSLQLTSGTTGVPKAIMMSHNQLVNVCYFSGRRLGFHEKVHKMCMPAPLFRCAAMMLGSLSVYVHGITAVFPSKIPSMEKALMAIDKERCTSLFGNPAMMSTALNLTELDKYDLSCLEGGMIGGSGCSPEQLTMITSKLHLTTIATGLPMTETGGITVMTRPDDSINTKALTCGFALDHIENKVIGDEGGILPTGAIGEICIRGYAVPLGQYGGVNEVPVDEDGWIHSGDTGLMDDNGYISICGREKDVIRKGNDIIYPYVIEDVLSSHPQVKGAQVIGVPDAKFGEEICACVILKCEESEITEEVLKSFCETHNITVPEYIRFVKDFPKTSTMKIQKYKLKAQMIEQLNR